MDIPEETKLLETPTGAHKVLVRSYMTGKDRRDHRRLVFQLSEEGKNEKVDALEAAEDALMRAIIIEIDGDKENIVERVIGMHADDYDFVVGQVVDISKGLDDKKKAT